MGDGPSRAGISELIAGLDATRSPLGPHRSWPATLKTVVGTILASPMPIVLFWGPDYVALYNAAFASAIGRNHPRALGRPAIENWNEFWGVLEPLLQKVSETGEPIHDKDRAFTVQRRGAPALAYFDIAYSAVPESDGKVGGVLCLVNETTERVLGEQALRDSRTRLEAMSNSVEHMLWSSLPDGRHEYSNDRYYEYCGLKRDTILDANWGAHIHPDDRERIDTLWRRSLLTGEPYRAELRILHHSGHWRWVLARAQAERNAAGRITRWHGSTTEIQDIVDAREFLARSREKLTREVAERTAERDEIWRSSQDLLGVADLSGVWQSVNPAWTSTLGWLPEEILGRSTDWILHPDDEAATHEEVSKIAAGHATLSFENRFRAKDGSYRCLSWTARPVGDRIYTVARDITERRALEERLHQAQKMEAVGQLTGGIAHDFNNMLAVVIGGLNLLERHLLRGNTDVGRYIAGAMDGATRAASLTQRLLAFSRQQPLEPEPIDPNGLIAGMADLLRRSLGEAVRVETILAGDLWRAHADPSQLENAILNLSVNARDAMTEGGLLTIETGNVTIDATEAAHHDVAPGEYVRIEVSDTGTGMSEEVAAKAFDPFFTTKSVGKGTGLGLSQVFGFVRQSGGSLKIRSKEGFGTTVSILMPRSEGEIAEVPARPDLTHTPEGDASETVLVVEDEGRVRTNSVEALRELGYTVLQASSGREALATLSGPQNVSLLFTDIVMPEMNGRELAKRAAEIRPGLRILFTTGYTGEPHLSARRVEIGGPVLQKPFDIAQLATKVRAVLDG